MSSRSSFGLSPSRRSATAAPPRWCSTMEHTLRSAIVVQDDVLNDAGYPSTIVVPRPPRLADTDTLRVRLPADTAGLERESDAPVAQVVSSDSEWRRSLRDRATPPSAPC